MDKVLDQESAEKAVDTYDQFVGYELCLTDELGRTIITRVTMREDDNKFNPIGSKQTALFIDHS